MKLRTLLVTFALTTGGALGAPSLASAGEKFENLKVLKDTGKDLEKGMKNLSKGLGVKCTACHVKGDFDSDKVPTKDATRKFFTAAVGAEKPDEAALKELLSALKLEKLKKAEKFWKGVKKLEKK